MKIKLTENGVQAAEKVKLRTEQLGFSHAATDVLTFLGLVSSLSKGSFYLSLL